MVDPGGGQHTVIVTGDVTVDWNLARRSEPASGSASWQVSNQSSLTSQPGGALLLADLLDAVLEDSGCKVVRSFELPTQVRPADPRFHHAYAVWTEYPATAGTSQPAWRLDEFLGVERAAEREAGTSPPHSETGRQAPALIVIDDAGLGFRDDSANWPVGLTSTDATSWVLLKMGSPAASGKLWSELYRYRLDRLVVIVSVDALREMDIQISRGLSWERTALDLAWELVHNPRVNALSQVHALAVTLGTAGIFLMQRSDDGHTRSRLIFDPAVLEGEWRRGYPGTMVGLTTVMSAALARQLLVDPEPVAVEAAIRRGLGAMRLLHSQGYAAPADGERTQLRFPHAAIAAELTSAEAGFAVAPVPDADRTQPGDASRQRMWTILEDTQANRIDELATEIVEQGVAVALGDVPVGRFGYLVTVDRREIESFRSIRTLIAEYAGQLQSRPLSLAVFGAPGAGKSFGVTQVAQSVLPGQIEVLTFNISQFDDPDELLGAFHQVRDVGLGGKLPLVFWDEFDAALGDRPYGWLRTFLAPMQDGGFLEGQIEHPIGRAIFVFAGGTSSRMEHFGEMVDEAAFRAAKGPDFVSRLKGYVDVMGPNAQADNGSPGAVGDPYAVIRRAVLLRSILERNAPQVIYGGRAEIDPGVLRGFLQTGRYKHGVRSMEAIVAMSTLTGRIRYERSSLPPESQLELHVDCRDFMARVQQLELDGELLERLAEATHNAYLEMDLNAPFADLDYRDLPEEAREQNRAAVRDIPARLAEIGYVMLPARSQEPSTELSDAHVERLAELEHERYVRERLTTGWRYGPERNDRLRTHPALVYWRSGDDDDRRRYSEDERQWLGPGPLPDDEKEKDRALVRAIPRILASAGYIIKPVSRA